MFSVPFFSNTYVTIKGKVTIKIEFWIYLFYIKQNIREINRMVNELWNFYKQQS